MSEFDDLADSDLEDLAQFQSVGGPVALSLPVDFLE